MLCYIPTTELKPMNRIVAQNIESGVVYRFNNAKEASAKLNADSSHIIKCCRGKRSKHKGHIWYYEKAVKQSDQESSFWTYDEDTLIRKYFPSSNLETLIAKLKIDQLKML